MGPFTIMIFSDGKNCGVSQTNMCSNESTQNLNETFENGKILIILHEFFNF